jgi:hypothetical protein
LTSDYVQNKYGTKSAVFHPNLESKLLSSKPEIDTNNSEFGSSRSCEELSELLKYEEPDLAVQLAQWGDLKVSYWSF